MTPVSTYVLVLFMSGPDPYLTELADLAMDLARLMHRRAKAATSDADAASCVAAFERMARSVRLTRMLEDRLSRARREDHDRRLDHRKAQLKSALDLTIENQAGLAQGVRLRRELAERLEHDRISGALGLGSIEQHLARITKLLGLYLPREAATAEPPYLPREAAGGEPPAERSEEPGVEGASPTHSASNGDAAFSNHEPHEPHEQALTPSAGCDSS